MHKIAYSIICSTALVLAAFAPDHTDRFCATLIALAFAFLVNFAKD